MHYFREESNGRLVVIDNDCFFADGIRFPLNDLWGIKGIYYTLSENTVTSVTEGIGNVVIKTSGCLLGPILRLCGAIIGIFVLVYMLDGRAPSIFPMIFPLLLLAGIIIFFMKGIGAGTGKAVQSLATKTFYLLILSKNGEHKVLEGMPEEFLARVGAALNQAFQAKKSNI